jgi:hypothetical protein
MTKIIISTRNLRRLTCNNKYTEARLLISQRLKNKLLTEAYKGIIALQNYPTNFKEVFFIRSKLDEDLLTNLKEQCENYQEVLSKL